MTTNTIDKWCAVCGKFQAHTIQREGVNARGEGFIVTEGMCDTCRDRSSARWATVKETIDRARRAIG